MMKPRCSRTILLFALLFLPALRAGAGAEPDQGGVRRMIEIFTADQGSLGRFYPLSGSPAAAARMRAFYGGWRDSLAKLDFSALGQESKVDYLLLDNYLRHQLSQLDRQAESRAESAPLLPFADAVTALVDARRFMQPVNPESTAAALTRLLRQTQAARASIEADVRAKKKTYKSTVANRASATAAGLRSALKRWFEYYDGYDPQFSWWVGEPYKALDAELEGFAAFLKETVGGISAGDTDRIIGDPIGRKGLMDELAYEMIPYTPEELVAIANKEFAWCETEMKKASRELGYGDDWKKALEYVKTQHVAPGAQPALVKGLAEEAIRFVDSLDLVTIPPVARESWRMEMLSPEQQKVSPFFLGGEVIQVAFPTNTMDQDQKMMSLRGNNVHFSRATVFHELIPGHHLQGYMIDRYRPYRQLFYTPFWIEGNALYWEMVFWDLGFPKTPENKIGMLFWRMHRCARIIFSLSFHLEKMTPQECVDFLVDRVGHERANAAAEVRRSVSGGYGPLYQCAYMLGALQFRALRAELVGTGKMTNRAFHDAILQGNSIPVEMVRAGLTDQPLTRDYTTRWKFYGPDPLGK
jgi:uncharacterized protein (DUF885 family)